MASVHFVQGPRGSGITQYARDLACPLPGMAYMTSRPFRAPHHTCSETTLVEELAMSATGVLFLDELVEFHRRALARLFRVWCVLPPEAQPDLVLGFPTDAHLPGDSPLRGLVRIAELLPPVDHHVRLASP